VALSFDLDTFIGECRDFLASTQPRLAVRDVVDAALREPASVADALRPRRGGITLLHHAPDLTIIDVVWAPGMEIFAHDHRMWAVIGVYTGREHNTFYRRPADVLVRSGAKTLDTGDVAMLGDDTIHAVANPSSRLTGAIHVYGGDFVNQPRSQWRPPSLTREPYDSTLVAREFEAANAAAGL
jgi:predicted metal-dependent enzyme (double-stranded beta helix superfamily)